MARGYTVLVHRLSSTLLFNWRSFLADDFQKYGLAVTRHDNS
jgi:hypothetical protein